MTWFERLENGRLIAQPGRHESAKYGWHLAALDERMTTGKLGALVVGRCRRRLAEALRAGGSEVGAVAHHPPVADADHSAPLD